MGNLQTWAEVSDSSQKHMLLFDVSSMDWSEQMDLP
jgi:hypothetical protein